MIHIVATPKGVNEV